MKRITLIDKAFLLKKTPLFGSLDLDLLLPIADKLTLSEYDAGEIIFGIGEQANRMFLIVRGFVELKDLHKKTFAKLSGEDFFGDEAIFNEKNRAYEAFSQSDTILLSLSRTNLLTIISECPSVALGFLQVYTTTFPIRQQEFNNEHS